MYIQDDGIRLLAKLEMPEGKEKCPLVIILHGFTGHMEEEHLTALSAALNRAGFATLRADLYGHGGSGGTFRNHTLHKWLGNTMTLIDYARGLDFVTGLYLCGHSQGGLTAILGGAMKQEILRGIIALAPACMIPELARNGGLLGTAFDPKHVPEEMTVWESHVLGGNYVRVARTIHVEDAVDRFAGPVLVVQGDADDPALVRSAKEAAARYRDCRLVLIPGGTHCFGESLDQMTGAVLDWIMEREG